MNINLLSLASAIVLLIGSIILGFLGKSVEMGLAIVAGAIGLAFSNIDKLKSFEGVGFKAEMREKIKAVVEKETEQDSGFIESTRVHSTHYVETSESKILEALGNQKYTWRTLSGISTESNINKNEVKTIINNLIEKGYVNESKGTDGQIWSLTGLGRRQLVVNALLKQRTINQ